MTLTYFKSFTTFLTASFSPCVLFIIFRSSQGQFLLFGILCVCLFVLNCAYLVIFYHMLEIVEEVFYGLCDFFKSAGFCSRGF